MLFKNIKETNLQERQKKEKDSIKIEVTNLILGDSQKLAIDSGNKENITDEQVKQEIRKILKGVTDTIQILKNKKDFSEKDPKYICSIKEKEILESFLPKQLTTQDIIEIIQNNNLKDMKIIMNYFKENYNGCYNGKELQEIAKTI